MENQINEGVDATPEEKEEGETAPVEEEKTGISGEAVDGTKYTVDSPEVIAYKEIFPDVNDDAAIGSIISIHNTIFHGDDPAGAETIASIVKMIREKITPTADSAE